MKRKSHKKKTSNARIIALYKFRNLWHSSKQEEGPCKSSMSATASKGFLA